MVQLGVNSPESQKEQELKKSGGLQDVPVVITLPTSPPAVRAKSKTCCSMRVVVCVSVVGVLVAIALAGSVLGLYLHSRRHCIDWGCWDMEEGNRGQFFGDDMVYPPDYDVFPSSHSSSGQDYPNDDERDGHRDGHHDGDGHRDDGDLDHGHHHGPPHHGPSHEPPPPPRPVY